MVILFNDFEIPAAIRPHVVLHLLQVAFVDQRLKAVGNGIEPGVPPDFQTHTSALAALVHNHGFRVFGHDLLPLLVKIAMSPRVPGFGRFAEVTP